VAAVALGGGARGAGPYPLGATPGRVDSPSPTSPAPLPTTAIALVRQPPARRRARIRHGSACSSQRAPPDPRQTQRPLSPTALKSKWSSLPPWFVSATRLVPEPTLLLCPPTAPRPRPPAKQNSADKVQHRHVEHQVTHEPVGERAHRALAPPHADHPPRRQLHAEADAEHKAADRREEGAEEGVEGEGTDEDRVRKQDDARGEDVGEVGVDQRERGRRRRCVDVVELHERRARGGGRWRGRHGGGGGPRGGMVEKQ